MVLALKYDFFGEKIQKNHNFSVSTILDIEDLILDTVRYCEKVRDLNFPSILDTIFSKLTQWQIGDSWFHVTYTQVGHSESTKRIYVRTVV